jgi:hypothetical protein
MTTCRYPAKASTSNTPVEAEALSGIFQYGVYEKQKNAREMLLARL